MSASAFDDEMAPANDDPSNVDDLYAEVDNAKKEDKKSKKEQKEKDKAFEELKKAAGIDGKKKFTPEEIAKRQELVLKLTAMGSHPRFEEWFKKNDFALEGKALRDKTIEELEELLIRAKQTMRMKTRPVWMYEAALGVTGIVEGMAMSYPKIRDQFDITGLREVLSKSDEFQDILAEIELDYTSISNMPPETILLMTVGKTAMAVAGINKFVKRQRASLAAQIPPANPTTSEPAAAETSSSTSWNFTAPPPPAPATASSSASTSSPPVFPAPSSFKK
jgi:hypothetical protein